MNYLKPRGTEDILYSDMDLLRWLHEKIRKIANSYNFNEIATPTFEERNLFIHSIGDNTDIVQKEMFLLETKTGKKVYALKPEGTSPVIRSIIENKIYDKFPLPLKFFYIQSMYRYERPQKGRLRQFSQFGIEVIGEANPFIESECIMMASSFLKEIGLKNKTVSINSLGNSKTRQNYKIVLKKYFNNKTMCDDCKTRIITNPLRILDCKIDSNNFNDIPKIYDYLEEKEKKYLNDVMEILKNNNIKYKLDNNLVRGLDYYTSIVFEITNGDNPQWSQNTLIGGGRYDKLIHQLGGKDLPAFGFGMGIERILIEIKSLKDFKSTTKNTDVFFISLSEKAFNLSFLLCSTLRKNNIKSDFNKDRSKDLKRQFRISDKLNSKFTIIIGEKELKTNTINIKNNKTKVKVNVNIKDMLSFIKGEL